MADPERTTAPPAAPPAPPPPAPTGTGFDWKGTLGESYAEHEAVLAKHGWNGPADVVKAYAGLEKLVTSPEASLRLGGDRLAIPGADAKPEEWANVWAKLGRPDKPDGYGLAKPEGFDGYDEGNATWFKDAAHKAGLTGSQAKALHDEWVSRAKSGAEETAASRARSDQAMEQDLRKEWGERYDARIEGGRRAVKALGLDGDTLAQLENSLGGASLMKLMGRIGERIGEDSLVGDKPQGGTSVRAQIAALESDPEYRKALMDSSHRGHGEAMAKRAKLFAEAYPESTR